VYDWALRGGYVVWLALAACSGPKVDLGGQPGGGTFVASPPITGGRISGAKACTIPATADAGNGLGPDDGGLVAILGTWKGYIEAYSFRQSRSDAVLLAFAAQADGTIQGTITFGVGPTPPPLTSDVLVRDFSDAGPIAYLNPGEAPAEGFPYTAAQVSFDGIRLRFSIMPMEPWKVWCPLQTSYDRSASGRGLCGCLPAIGEEQCNPNVCLVPGPCSPPVCRQKLLDTGQWVSLSDSWLELCRGGVCSCTAGSCMFDPTPGGPAFDVRFTVGHVDGTITGLDASLHNVHLTLSP
jgi:hypothetical protein